MPELIETWVDDINQQFDLYYEERDTKEMYRLAHTIKGSCLQFALDEIGQVGIEMLQKVKNNDWDSIYPYKKKLLDKFDEVKVLLDNMENNA
jgi:HPt (histidine-containing phosphotransfer) domain-containing protein